MVIKEIVIEYEMKNEKKKFEENKDTRNGSKVLMIIERKIEKIGSRQLKKKNC